MFEAKYAYLLVSFFHGPSALPFQGGKNLCSWFLCPPCRVSVFESSPSGGTHAFQWLSAVLS